MLAVVQLLAAANAYAADLIESFPAAVTSVDITDGQLQTFTVPPVFIGTLYVVVNGGDGGRSTVENPLFSTTSTGAAGPGASTDGEFRVGFEADEIPPGSEVRFIIGAQGESRDGGAGAGGGGGSAVYVREPGAAGWTLLIGAGGGGGASARLLAFDVPSSDDGGYGSLVPNGGDGGGGPAVGTGLGTGGLNGAGGEECLLEFANNADEPGGGGGGGTAGAGGSIGASIGGGGGGAASAAAVSAGGLGFVPTTTTTLGDGGSGWGGGGGGSGSQASNSSEGGGGGGGFSGGGGGCSDSGGGGGSYCSTLFSPTFCRTNPRATRDEDRVPADGTAGYALSPDPSATIFTQDTVLSVSQTIESTEHWRIQPGVVVTLAPSRNLVIRAGGSLDNRGFLLNRGTISNLGRITNATGATLNSIGNTTGDGILSNTGSIENEGAIYGCFNPLSGNAVIGSAPVLGCLLSARTSSSLGGQELCEGPRLRGDWSDPGACRIGGYQLTAGRTLKIETGTTLILEGRLTNEGTIENRGTLDDTLPNGVLNDCGTYVGNEPLLGQSQICTVSAEAALCTDQLGGAWFEAGPSCTITDYTVDAGETLTLDVGYVLIVRGTLENLGTLENYGTILNQFRILNEGSFINSGILQGDLGEGSSVFDNFASFVNFGVVMVDPGGAVFNNANIGSVTNQCGSTFLGPITPDGIIVDQTGDGAPCEDGDLCTLTDTCQSGVCTAGTPLECTELDQCHDVGVCNAETGECSNPEKVDGCAYLLGGPDASVTPSSAGWSWDGGAWIAAYRAALEDGLNFGASGVVPREIDTTGLAEVTSETLAALDGFIVTQWADTETSGAEAAAAIAFFLAGGDLILLQEDADHDAIGAQLGVPTSPSDGSISNGGRPLFDGPFGTAMDVQQATITGQLAAADVAAQGGTVAATNASGEITAAIWYGGDYAAGAGRLLIVADVDMWATTLASYDPLDDNGTFALNGTATAIPEPGLWWLQLTSLACVALVALVARLARGRRDMPPGG